jgi:hypothetical protein
LRQKAEAVVVCEPKPLLLSNIAPYKGAVHAAVLSVGGIFGLRTQIVEENLKHDGYHVKDSYIPVIALT